MIFKWFCHRPCRKAVRSSINWSKSISYLWNISCSHYPHKVC